jgi:PAS domain S-box-containing protein
MSAAETGERSWTVPATPRSVGVLRDRAHDFALSQGADPALVQTIRLAVSEGATNAVMHAFLDREPGTITLVCEAGPGELRVQIADDGVGMQPRTDSPGLGLGLSTMGKLATRMDVRTSRSGVGTTVRLVFRAPGVQGSGRIAHDDPTGRMLIAASDLARSAAWPDEGFEQLCELALPLAADASCVDVVEHGCLRRLAAAVHGDELLTGRLRRLVPILKPGTATWAALHGAGAQLVLHDPTVPRAPTGPGALLGLGWWLSVPLVAADGKILALWGLGGRGDRPPPDEATVALISEAGMRAAGGLAHAQVLAGMQDTRRRLEAVLSALTEAVSVTDAEGRIAYANDAAVRLFGAGSAAEVVGQLTTTWLARFHITDEDGEPLRTEQLPSRRLHRGEPAEPLVTRSVNRTTGQAQWLRTSSRKLEDPDDGLVVNIVEDITETVRGEQRARAMIRVGELLDDATDIAAALDAVAALLAPGLADGCAIDRLDADGRLQRVALAHPDPAQHARLVALHARWPTSADPPTLDALARAEPRVVDDIDDAFLQARAYDADHLALLREIGFRSMVVAPLRAAGRTLGLLTLAHDRRSVRTFDVEDVAFIVDVARRVGTAIALRA